MTANEPDATAYIEQVAVALVLAGVFYDTYDVRHDEEPMSAVIKVKDAGPDGQQLVFGWDEVSGWNWSVEDAHGVAENVFYMGGGVLPGPIEVADWASQTPASSSDLLRPLYREPGQDDDLAQALAAYTAARDAREATP